ncbi:hypothetical protein BaRGS_00019140 [Batillaria attramentaria]|uniref:Uncharacterized protein n=1 Tax=Batillaria attramentaria TaxID=370345 RepID=A0ABD0KSH8_9CAEN
MEGRGYRPSEWIGERGGRRLRKLEGEGGHWCCVKRIDIIGCQYITNNNQMDLLSMRQSQFRAWSEKLHPALGHLDRKQYGARH